MISLQVLTIPVTLWATALPEVTQPQVLRLLAGIALYYALVNWATTASRLWLLGVGLAGAGQRGPSAGRALLPRPALARRALSAPGTLAALAGVRLAFAGGGWPGLAGRVGARKPG